LCFPQLKSKCPTISFDVDMLLMTMMLMMMMMMMMMM